MDTIVECLISSRLFEGFDREVFLEISPLLNIHTNRRKKGEVLLHTDDVADYVGILIDGELAVLKDDAYGTSHLIRKVFPGEIFACDVASTHSQISPYIVACTSASLIASIPFHLLSKKSALPDEYRSMLLSNILSILSSNSMRQLYKTEILSTNSLRERIILYLSHQSKRHASLSFKISFSRDEMAAYLCVDRSALSRELSRMQKENLINFKKNEFKIAPSLVRS